MRLVTLKSTLTTETADKQHPQYVVKHGVPNEIDIIHFQNMYLLILYSVRPLEMTGIYSVYVVRSMATYILRA